MKPVFVKPGFVTIIFPFFSSIVPTDSEIANLNHLRRDQLILTKFLGSGAFGEVFEGVVKSLQGENCPETRIAVKVGH